MKARQEAGERGGPRRPRHREHRSRSSAAATARGEHRQRASSSSSRSRRGSATADQVIGRLRGKLAKVEGIQLYLQAVQDVRVGGRSSRTQYQFTLQDPNLDELQRSWAPQASWSASRSCPQLRDVATDQQTAGLQLDVNIDRDTASRLGITPRKPSTMRCTTRSASARSPRSTRRSTSTASCSRCRAELPATDPEACCENLYASAPGDRHRRSRSTAIRTRATPALEHAALGQPPGPVPGGHALLQPRAGRRARPGRRRASTRPRRRDRACPPASTRAFQQGTAQAFQRRLAARPRPWLLILAALIAVYIVLGVLYESTIHPITILSTPPRPPASGALLALMLFKTGLQQHHRAHRDHPAHRHREEERDHDDRLVAIEAETRRRP